MTPSVIFKKIIPIAFVLFKFQRLKSYIFLSNTVNTKIIQTAMSNYNKFTVLMVIRQVGMYFKNKKELSLDNSMLHR